MIETARDWLELGAAIVEAFAFGVIAVGFVWALARYFAA